MTAFVIPNITVDVPQEELEPLLAELDKLAKTRFGLDADNVAGGIRQGGQVFVDRIPGGHRAALRRALDHLHHCNSLPDALGTVRGALLMDGITYTVRHMTTSDQQIFYSYSGEYEEGDRIVYGSPTRFSTVMRLLADEDPYPLLLCSP